MPDATINGHKHHWEEGGTGEPLIMLHGAASSGRGFYQHLPELSKTFRVIIPDMRGMGQSAHVETLDPPSAWSDDVEGLIDHLGLGDVHLYGSSLGARVALRVAIDRPQQVRTLILDNPIVLNEGAGNDALNARMADPTKLPADAQERYRSQHGEDWAEVVRNYFVQRNEPALQEHYNLRELAKAVTIPTLLGRGDDIRDLVHPILHAVELRHSLRNSKLWIKPEGGVFATPEGYEVVRTFIATAAREPATA